MVQRWSYYNIILFTVSVPKIMLAKCNIHDRASKAKLPYTKYFYFTKYKANAGIKPNIPIALAANPNLQ